MPSDFLMSRCEVRHQLQARLEAVEAACRKAHEILKLSSDSPDSIRRRRNSVQHWDKVYAAARESLHSHTREHGCDAVTVSGAVATGPLY